MQAQDFVNLVQAATDAARLAATVAQSIQGTQVQNSEGRSMFSEAHKVVKQPESVGANRSEEDAVNWPDWRLSFRALIIFADPLYEQDLNHAELSKTEVTIKPDAPEAETRSKRLLAILSSLLTNKPARLLEEVPNRI